MSSCFSADYAQARDQFRRLAGAANAVESSYALTATGPGQLPLITDFAWLGSESPQTMVIVQSGVHGVEAFAGSAIQCRLLQHPPVLSNDTALLLVHVLNPFGMAWLRRANESNVDLNRNCLNAEQSYEGAAQSYERLNGLINPVSPPRWDFFTLRAAYRVWRHGMAALKESIAGGQYEYPHGLFYGGAKLEEGPRLYRHWLREHIQNVARIVVVDLHTGLGRFGQHQVFTDHIDHAHTGLALQKILGGALVVDHEKSDGYAIKGGMSNIYLQVFDRIQLIYLTVEFGTYSPIKVLHALREENRCHFHTDGDLGHPAKQRLRRALCPDSTTWREQVVTDGTRLVSTLLQSPPASIQA